MATTSAASEYDGATAVGYEVPYNPNDKTVAPSPKGKAAAALPTISEGLPFIDDTAYLSTKR